MNILIDSNKACLEKNVGLKNNIAQIEKVFPKSPFRKKVMNFFYIEVTSYVVGIEEIIDRKSVV